MKKREVKPLVGIKPAGARILVENLDAQEAMGTSLVVNPNMKQEVNQGYILALGPTVPEEYGFKVGQRVVLQGAFNPVPRIPGYERELGIVEATTIRAILEEEE